ncbi:hypothetical protein SFMTTN_2075 [Sulfuriferula multivorans]|uniref:DUF2116 family Zn-ribbon domain-containing protein n=1 Tax=Sulfuriferula multivorans TaxID=1559896 RepID=A0A401JF55_9PROT|nr:hypothetical protein [Sulfuriferula multivorans]GBL46262.1 hypothetical protein SFMTTN_2075 [Sulfuriferula multivorans]
MDIFDRAQEVEEKERAACLDWARNRPSMLPSGHCYNCDEDLAAGKLFCDADCRDDYQKRTGRK